MTSRMPRMSEATSTTTTEATGESAGMIAPLEIAFAARTRMPPKRRALTTCCKGKETEPVKASS
jgi:hypothetical protein